MDIQVISIGTELLIGETLNSNLLYLGRELAELGLGVDREVAIPDDRALMRRTFQEALAESRLVLSIGGLGPTADDLTREVAAEALGRPLAHFPETAERIRTLYEARGLTNREASIAAQSLAPAGAETLTNNCGTAPGIHCEADGRHLVLLPGPPRELHAIWEDHLRERVPQWLAPRIVRRTVSVFGQAESLLEDRVRAVLEAFPGIEPAYCVGRGSCRVRLSAPLDLAAQVEAAVVAVAADFGPDATLGAEADLIGEIGRYLQPRGWWLGTAESCTGGLIAQLVTERPGVSSFFKGGVVSYANELKQHLLGVRSETLAAHGAVSAETAEEMVRGLATRHGLQAGIAVTGIAGPDGGTPEKPVGTVFIATLVDGELEVQRQVYPHSRQTMRERTAISALGQLRRQLRTMLNPAA